MKALYYPAQEDEQILRINDRRLCPAEVTEINIDTGRASLLVIDDYGTTHLRMSIAIGQCLEPDYCVLV